MAKSRRNGVSEEEPEGAGAIASYSVSPPALQSVCELLRELIDESLPKATSKIWHGSPVWFVADNPVVGYSANKKTVNLLFWNGQAFDEPELQPVGKYRAAQARFGDVEEVDRKAVRRWLKKAKVDVFDSKAFFKQLREKK